VVVEDTSDEDDDEETLQDRFQLRSRFSRPGLPHVPLVQDPPVVWTSLGPLHRWVPGPTTRWAPRTTRLALHGT
jgi:hypothetical protein